LTAEKKHDQTIRKSGDYTNDNKQTGRYQKT
jgi:hypothetical protein